MIEETLGRIESRLRGNARLSSRERADFLALLADLKQDLGLAAEQDDSADSLGSLLQFTASAAHEALRPDQDPELLNLALRGLERSAQRFEASHPRLVSIVRAIGKSLADIGI